MLPFKGLVIATVLARRLQPFPLMRHRFLLNNQGLNPKIEVI